MSDFYKLKPSSKQRRLLKKTANASLRVYNLILKHAQKNAPKWISDEVDIKLLSHSVILKDRAINIAKYSDIEIRSLDFAEELILGFLAEGDKSKLEKIKPKDIPFYRSCSKYLRVENGKIYVPKIGLVPIDVPNGVEIPKISSATFFLMKNEWVVKLLFND